MSRNFFIELANSSHAVPIGADLVLHEKEDHEAILNDGERLGMVIEETAKRFNTPLAMPLMDLRIEKAVMLGALGIPESDIETYHFHSALQPAETASIVKKISVSDNIRMSTTCGAIRYIVENTGLFPMGMCIGPFSLVTKLMDDPITAVYMKGMGTDAGQDPAVETLDLLLELSVQVIIHYLRKQIEAGARAVIMCEPAANTVYFSPKQIRDGSDIFDRCVIDNNRKIKDFLDDAGVDLVFHDCGELDDSMISRFVSLNPVMISLGSSRKLWEDERLIPKHIVIYGNLPTKKFFSDEFSREDAVGTASELIRRMMTTGHPFILGSECDVLSVPGKEDIIKNKVHAFLGCACRSCV
jgi:uroporphyrinogen-III decarboxylase